MNSDKKTLVVVGGGAAGFFCAINASIYNPHLRIIILEKTGKLLSKVKISGGGRCNVTHDCDTISAMIKCYPRGDNFLKKAFHHFFTNDTIDWFSKRGVKLVSESDGRMFPVSNSSQTIIDCFLSLADNAGIEIRMNKEVKSIIRTGNSISITLSNYETLLTDFICIASGGFAKSIQFDWLRAIGHSIEVPVPSLFTFNIKEDPIKNLMGITVPEAQVKINGSKFVQKGPLLITHWGFSGPCILKLSAFAARYLAEKEYSFSISINWLGGLAEQKILDDFRALRFKLSAQKFINRNPFGLPQRLWEYFMVRADINIDIRWADLPAKQQNVFVKNLCAQQFFIKGKTTFKEEFVTSGGINTSEVEVSSMESKLFPNLFFSGEILNIDGITGGYNFQNAWTTGYIAGKAIAERGFL